MLPALTSVGLGATTTTSKSGRHWSQASLEFVNPPNVVGPLGKYIRHLTYCLHDFTNNGFDFNSVHALKRLPHHLSQQCARVAVSPHSICMIPTIIEEDSIFSFVESFL